MGDGRKGVAPCGHAGEHVIGTYVRCTEGCEDLAKPKPEASSDGVPVAELDGVVTSELRRCPMCFSADVDAMGMISAAGDPLMHCWPCGATFV